MSNTQPTFFQIVGSTDYGKDEDSAEVGDNYKPLLPETNDIMTKSKYVLPLFIFAKQRKLANLRFSSSKRFFSFMSFLLRCCTRARVSVACFLTRQFFCRIKLAAAQILVVQFISVERVLSTNS